MRLYNWIVTKLTAFRNRNERPSGVIAFLLLTVPPHSIPVKNPPAGYSAQYFQNYIGMQTLTSAFFTKFVKTYKVPLWIK